MKTLAEINFSEGYASSYPGFGAPNGILATGSKNILVSGAGLLRGYRGPTLINNIIGARALFNAANADFAGLGDYDTPGKGSIISITNNALGFIGAGNLFINGAARGVSASTALQFVLFNNGTYFGTSVLTAGMNAPAAPTLAVSGTASTKMSGLYAVCLWRVRETTGGISNRSLPSAEVIINGFKARVTVPVTDGTHTRWGIGVSEKGKGAKGPLFELREFSESDLGTVDAVARSIALEWTDAELVGKRLAPIDDYPPPAAMFACQIEDVVCVIGAYADATLGVTADTPGSIVAISQPGYPESYAIDDIQVLPEPPTAVVPRPADGYCFVFTENTCNVLSYTGGRPAVSLKTLWPNYGIKNQGNVVIGEGGRLYAYVGRLGLVRIGAGGEPENAFSRRVAADFERFGPERVVLGWDADHQYILVCHNREIIPYNTQSDQWCAPLDLEGSIEGDIVACVTVGGACRIAVSDGASAIKLYRFNAGTGTLMRAVSGSILIPDGSANVNHLRIAMRADNKDEGVTVKVRRNGRLNAAESKTVTPHRTGKVILSASGLNARNCQAFDVVLEQQSAGGDAGFEAVQVLGETSSVRFQGD